MGLVPVGVAGELCVGGEGVGRGYLNRPELTAERFVQNPHRPEERLYRSGDLARRLPNGEMEYLGRIDHQVKIRGHRIELGEIESALLKHGEIKETVVTVFEDENGGESLCAYIVMHEGGLDIKEIREHLGGILPEYMIPAYFVTLDSIPLTVNGKVDRKKLPRPEGNIDSGEVYEAPRNQVEAQLAWVWGEVLGIQKMGINDSFFMAGGDSIKAIQVAARLNKHGLKMEIKDLFKNPTIKEISPYIKYTAINVEQGMVEGEAPLTPIQQWFFKQELTDKHHWNQAFMLYNREGFNEAALRKALIALVEHHDVLRMVYKEDSGKLAQYNRGIYADESGREEKLFTLEVIELSGEDGYEARIEAEATRIQGSMDLTEGPLVKLGLFKTTTGDHLLIAIHHLVVDGVSWRIILEDLERGYRLALKNETITLQEKTASYKNWAGELLLYAENEELQAELKYWKNCEQIFRQELSESQSIKKASLSECRTISKSLSETETGKLLHNTNRAYHTGTNDILLAALAIAANESMGKSRVVVDLEGHGRENIGKDIDISRTVGWFTTIYPVILESREPEDIRSTIKITKEMLKRVPNNGIGYGVLRYLCAHEEEDARLALDPEISFNYLGQFDGGLTQMFEVSKVSSGFNMSPRSEKMHHLDIACLVVGGKLVINLNYNTNACDADTAERFMQSFQKGVVDIITHCDTIEKPEITPSDLGDENLSFEDFETITELESIENIKMIYPLSTMQEGMLFHALREEKTNVYFEQMAFSIESEFDKELLEKSFNLIIKRYDVLRTNFIYQKIQEPKQVVFKEREAVIEFQDITGLDGLEREAYVAEYKKRDMEKGFDLAQDMLVRIGVLKTGNSQYKMIFSFHHIIMDGRCVSIVFGEMLGIYHSLREGKTPEIKEIKPYYGYIQWLRRKNKESARRYWRRYLEGYEQRVLLPDIDKKAGAGGYKRVATSVKIDETLTATLEKIAARNKVTLNIILETVWGLLLQKYNNHHDVVFGKVVSGRPPEIEGIENMVGLFINTVPVRVTSIGARAQTTVNLKIYLNQCNRRQWSQGNTNMFPWRKYRRNRN